MLQIRHDKYVHKINCNEKIISYHSLRFSLKLLLFDGVYKISIFVFIPYPLQLLNDKTWVGDNIYVRHQFSHLFGQPILISKVWLVDNNERINSLFIFFHKIA